MIEFLPLFLFAAVFVALLAGYSVAATLAGVALVFALVGAAFGIFDLRDLGFLPSRLYGLRPNAIIILRSIRTGEDEPESFQVAGGERLPEATREAVPVHRGLKAPGAADIGAPAGGLSEEVNGHPALRRTGNSDQLCFGLLVATGDASPFRDVPFPGQSTSLPVAL